MSNSVKGLLAELDRRIGERCRHELLYDVLRRWAVVCSLSGVRFNAEPGR